MNNVDILKGVSIGYPANKSKEVNGVQIGRYQ